MKAFLHCTYTAQTTSKEWQNLKKDSLLVSNFIYLFLVVPGISVLQTRIEPGPLTVKACVLTTGLPVNVPQLISSKTTVSQEYCLILPTGAEFLFKKWAHEYHSCI